MKLYYKLQALCLFTMFVLFSAAFAQHPYQDTEIGHEEVFFQFAAFSSDRGDEEGRYAPEGVRASPQPEVEEYVAYASKYVWRGLDLVNGSVLQPKISLSQCNFTATLWGNFDLSNVNNNAGKFSEVDIKLDYSSFFKLCSLPLRYSFGIIHYVYPATSDPDTTETYVGISFESYISTAFFTYYDFDEVNGWYLNLACWKKWENIFCPRRFLTIGFEARASLGWGNKQYNEFYFGVEQNRFLDLLFTLGMPSTYYCWNFAPFISYSYLVAPSIRENNVFPSSNLWGGIALSRTF